MLLPLLPLLLASHKHPRLACWLPAVACFSMYPLLAKDGLQLAYGACLLLWAGVCLLGDFWNLHKLEDATNSPRTQPQQLQSPQQAASGSIPKPPAARNSDRALGRKGTTAGPRLGGGEQQMLAQAAGLAAGGSFVAAATLHLMMVVAPPPAKLRYLYDMLIVTLSFAHLVVAAAWLNFCQWRL